MKKALLTLASACSLALSANAQLALENFNHAGALPAGWVMVNDGHTVSSSFTTLTWLQDSLDVHAWFPVGVVSATDYSMITTSKFTPSGTPHRWLISPSFMVNDLNMVIQWDDYDLGSYEPTTVLVSGTGDTAVASFTSIYHAPAGAGTFVTHQVPIGSYNGSTIRVAFRDDTTNNWGLVVDNVKTTVLSSLDLGVTSLNLAPFVQTSSVNTIAGSLHNYGVTTVTSMNINYNVNGGTIQTSSISGISVPLGSDYNYTHSTTWTPSSAGTYTIKVWADNINGGTDGNHSNDTFTATVLVIDTLQPKNVMIEEFTQASCDPCAAAAPNVDSVFTHNLSRASLVRYHVNWPGRDCMDSVTLSPFVSTRVSYYAVGGVPDAQLDGQYIYPGAGGLSTAAIGTAASFGSPLNVNVTSATYNPTTNTYALSASIVSHGPIAAGLKAYAVLVVDTLTYHSNQSTESTPQTVFPQVAENMFPNASGTTLSAFTTGSTQTITSSWVKNHRWGSNYSVWSYDSTTTGKIIVWVENDNTKYVYQSGQANITITTGVNSVTASNASMNIYPNPASSTARIALDLKTAATVKMEVYTITGQRVYSMPSENRNAGVSVSTIDVSGFANGDYIVSVSVDGMVLNQKLTVMK